jgi:hypothetical protein
MSFRNGCACHVWALDGWLDDGLARDVNENYANAGTAMALGVMPPGGLNGRVTRLLADCRMTPAVAQPGILYGGFANVGDATPTHMWFEHGGYVYDTMPGAPIRRLPATTATRIQPPSEVGAFVPNLVGYAIFSLSATQSAIVTNGAIAWGNETVGGRLVGTYLPPN